MAEAFPHVKEHLDILVATRNEHWFSTTRSSLHTEKPHPEINRKNLKNLWKRHSPITDSKLERTSTAHESQLRSMQSPERNKNRTL